MTCLSLPMPLSSHPPRSFLMLSLPHPRSSAVFTLDLLSLPAVSKALAGHAKYGALHKLVAAVLAGDVAGGILLLLRHPAPCFSPKQYKLFASSQLVAMSTFHPAFPDASAIPWSSHHRAATRAASTPAALEAAGPGVSAEGVLSKARMTALLVACSSTSSSAAGSGEVALAELQKVLDVPADQVGAVGDTGL